MKTSCLSCYTREKNNNKQIKKEKEREKKRNISTKKKTNTRIDGKKIHRQRQVLVAHSKAKCQQ